MRRIFGSLSPDVVASLAERHRLEPVGPTPWIKTFTGGSDDHGGFYIGTTWTRTPAAATVEEYLGHLRAGRHEPGGDTGSSLRLVQSLYGITWEYYRRQFPALLGNRKDPFAELLRNLAHPGSPPVREEERAGLRERLAQVIAFPGTRRTAPADAAASPSTARPSPPPGRRSANRSPRSPASSSATCGADASPRACPPSPTWRRSPFRRPPTWSPSRPSTRTPTSSRRPPSASSAAFPRRISPAARPGSPRRRRMTEPCCPSRRARMGRHPLGDCGQQPSGLPVRSFEPLLELPLPGDGSRPLRVPPLLEILDLCERERYTEILIATPGPIGLAGLAAGKLLGIRTAAVYAAGFPRYLQYLAGSPALEELAWAYMRWFCGQMDCVYVDGHAYHDLLVRRGFDPARMEPLPVERSRMAG